MVSSPILSPVLWTEPDGANQNSGVAKARRLGSKAASDPPPSPNFFRAWRDYCGFTQERLGELVDCTGSHLSQIENGKSGWSSSLLEAMAKYLEVEPAWLLGRDPNDPDSIWAIAEELAALPTHKRRKLIDAAKLLDSC